MTATTPAVPHNDNSDSDNDNDKNNNNDSKKPRWNMQNTHLVILILSVLILAIPFAGHELLSSWNGIRGEKLTTSTEKPLKRAWVTLLANDIYNYTLMVDVQIQTVEKYSEYEHVTLVLPQVSQSTKDHLSKLSTTLVEVDPVESPFPVKDKQWEQVFAKLHVWSMTRLDQVAFIDADAFLQSHQADQVFDECDQNWVICGVQDVTGVRLDDQDTYAPAMNAGLLVVRPDRRLFHRLIHQALPRARPYKYPEQGFLSDLFHSKLFGDFGDYKYLNWKFNTCSQDYFAAYGSCVSPGKWDLYSQPWMDCFQTTYQQVAIHHMCGYFKLNLWPLCVWHDENDHDNMRSPMCSSPLLQKLQHHWMRANPCVVGSRSPASCDSMAPECVWQGDESRCVPADRLIMVHPLEADFRQTWQEQLEEEERSIDDHFVPRRQLQTSPYPGVGCPPGGSARAITCRLQRFGRRFRRSFRAFLRGRGN